MLTQLSSADGDSELRDQPQLLTINRHGGVQVRIGRRRFSRWHQRQDEAGADLVKQVILAIDHQAAVVETVNIKLRHQNSRYFSSGNSF